MPDRPSDGTRHCLTWGLEARMDELQRDSRTGYFPRHHDARVDALVEATREAYGMGLLSYLPKWAL